jgi:hypothetical protein
VLTWMVQPPDTTPATTTALILGASGVLVYAILVPVDEPGCREGPGCAHGPGFNLRTLCGGRA